MIKHYIVMAVRGLVREHVFIGVAIVGLAVSITITLFVVMYVNYQLSYDNWVQDHENIYRLESDQRRPNRPTRRMASAPAALLPYLQSGLSGSPIVSAAFENIVSVATSENAFVVSVQYVDSEFLSIFNVETLFGDPETSIADPRSLILTEREAIRLFGVADVVDRIVTIDKETEVRVGAVITNWPPNSNLNVDALMSITSSTFADHDLFMNNWGSIGGSIFLKFERIVETTVVGAQINQLLAKYAPPLYGIGDPASGSLPFYTLRIRPLNEIHLISYGTTNTLRDKQVALASLVTISILVLLVGASNVANLLLAKTKSRNREYLVRKTLGASTVDFVVQFLIEAALLFSLATILSIVVTITGFRVAARMFSLNLEPNWGDPLVLGICFGLPVILSLLLGLPLAMRTLRDPLAFESSHKGGSGRLDQISMTTILQFSVAIVFGSVALANHKQISHLENFDLGFVGRNTLILWDTNAIDNPETLRARIAELSGVSSIGFASTVPTDFNSFSMSASSTKNPESVTLRRYNLSPEAFALLKIEPIAGRLFMDSRIADRTPYGTQAPVPVILTESAVLSLGFDTPDRAIGDEFRQLYGSEDGRWRMARVVGVVKNLSFNSALETAEPAAIVFDPTEYSRLLIQVEENEFTKTLSDITDIWRDMNPLQPMQRDWLPSRLDDTIREEKRQFRLLTLCTIVAAVLSLIGLAAVASKKLESMSREIAIRQVVGATPLEILFLALRQFSSSIFLAILISLPAAGLVIRQFLSRYVNHQDTTYSSYILAALFAIVIGAVVVAVQTQMIARRPAMTTLAA